MIVDVTVWTVVGESWSVDSVARGTDDLTANGVHIYEIELASAIAGVRRAAT
jgi:hypothetical protein